MRKLFRPLRLSPKIFNWWFLAEHGACAIRKYSDVVGAEFAAATVGRAPTREHLAPRYSCRAKSAAVYAGRVSADATEPQRLWISFSLKPATTST